MHKTPAPQSHLKAMLQMCDMVGDVRPTRYGTAQHPLTLTTYIVHQNLDIFKHLCKSLAFFRPLYSVLYGPSVYIPVSLLLIMI